jgi:hypothetical protein
MSSNAKVNNSILFLGKQLPFAFLLSPLPFLARADNVEMALALPALLNAGWMHREEGALSQERKFFSSFGEPTSFPDQLFSLTSAAHILLDARAIFPRRRQRRLPVRGWSPTFLPVFQPARPWLRPSSFLHSTNFTNIATSPLILPPPGDSTCGARNRDNHRLHPKLSSGPGITASSLRSCNH